MKYKPGQNLKTRREVLEAFLEGHKILMGEDVEELGAFPFVINQDRLELDKPFNDTFFRKVAPRRRILNGVELDEPILEELEVGTKYYVPTLDSPNYFLKTWIGDRRDKERLEKGEVYLQQVSAVKHGEAARKWSFK